MPNGKQEKDFASEFNDVVTVTVGDNALDTAITWIGTNLDVEDVFSESKILDYARSFDVEKVFEESYLDEWAEKNGYIKEQSF